MAKDDLLAQLTDKAGTLPSDKRSSLSGWQQVLRYAIPVIFVIVLAIPAITYFIVNKAGDLLFGPGLPAEVRFYTLFRLFGLYAFTFLWGQLMVGPFMQPLGRLYGKNWFYFHRMQGLFALLLAVLHPIILYTAFIVWTGSLNWFEAVTTYTPHVVWVMLGETALALMIITVVTALLMNKPWMRGRWRWIHLLNYAVFALAWFHSYLLGSEVHTFPMSWLYPFFGLTFLISLTYRRLYRPVKKNDNLR